ALISMRPPTPKGMIKTPPISGPTRVAPLNAAEFRPIALMSCLSETRRGTIAWRVRVEREDDRVERADKDDLDDVYLIRDREESENGRGDCRARLCDKQEAPAIGAIGDNAAEEAEGEPGKRAGEADEAEIERRELRDAVLDREL